MIRQNDEMHEDFKEDLKISESLESLIKQISPGAERIVLDASILLTTQIVDLIEKHDNFIITKKTKAALYGYAETKSFEGYWSRRILKIAKENPEKIKSTGFYVEPEGNYKENVIQACKQKNYAIATTNKAIKAIAEREGVKCYYTKPDLKQLETTDAIIYTLKGQILFKECSPGKWHAILMRNGKLIKNAHKNNIELHDEICVAYRNQDNFEIKVYQVVSVTQAKHAILKETIKKKVYEKQENKSYEELAYKARMHL